MDFFRGIRVFEVHDAIARVCRQYSRLGRYRGEKSSFWAEKSKTNHYLVISFSVTTEATESFFSMKVRFPTPLTCNSILDPKNLEYYSWGEGFDSN